MDFPQKKGALDRGSEKGAYPFILAPWIKAYDACPKVYLPKTKVDIAFTLVCAFCLFLARRVCDFVIVHVFGWPVGAKMTIESAACAVSGFQAAIFVPSIGACILSQPYRPSGKMSDSPMWWQCSAKALIQFCSGYMVYDSIMLFGDTWDADAGKPVFASADLMFLGHHFATSFYMISALLQGAGHQSAMMLMFLGEMTSPLQNSHSILKFAVKIHSHSSFVEICLMYVELLYALVYIPLRAFIGPLVCAHLTYDLLLTKTGRKNCKVVVSMLWMPMCWGVLYGSIPWIEEAIAMARDGLELKYHRGFDYGAAYVYHNGGY
eukprot:TRINITY_DN50621_c0_g1_i1.p1 TRINITY_DN50621_c0_g1~~TRINITY_DN50621_c0_g1_i1.p1  ORF type:complete len:321 (-),score=29.66 TRINITY_DN50621_c0_g1_i1:16-978(-)